MKVRLILSVAAAALTLAACGSSKDEDAKDAALSADDVGAGDLTLTAGQYSSQVELVEFDLPGLPADVKSMAERAFADGAKEPSLTCVTKDSTPEEWISEMNQSNCTASDFKQSGNSFTATMQCKDAEGLNGTVNFEGTVGGDKVQMEARFEQAIPQVGTAKMHMRVTGTRVGDCS